MTEQSEGMNEQEANVTLSYYLYGSDTLGPRPAEWVNGTGGTITPEQSGGVT